MLISEIIRSISSEKVDISQFIVPTSNSAPKLFNFTNTAGYLRRLKKCASGYDGLSPKLLEEAKLEILDLHVPLFNIFLTKSFTPKQGFYRYILPIPKPQSASLETEYRTIGLSSTKAKFCETLFEIYN